MSRQSPTQERIRKAALAHGWTIKCRQGDEMQTFRGRDRWDRDIFVIGSVDRHLQDGTPVTEPEHEVEVWYHRQGQVHFAAGCTFTVPQVIHHHGITSSRQERDKADRVVAALESQTGVIPENELRPGDYGYKRRQVDIRPIV